MFVFLHTSKRARITESLLVARSQVGLWLKHWTDFRVIDLLMCFVIRKQKVPTYQTLDA